MAASWCFEYFETASCQPPTVPTDAARLPVRKGGHIELALDRRAGSGADPYWYGQLRAKAALPAWKACSVWSSWYVVTP